MEIHGKYSREIQIHTSLPERRQEGRHEDHQWDQEIPRKCLMVGMTFFLPGFHVSHSAHVLKQSQASTNWDARTWSLKQVNGTHGALQPQVLISAAAREHHWEK